MISNTYLIGHAKLEFMCGGDDNDVGGCDANYVVLVSNWQPKEYTSNALKEQSKHIATYILTYLNHPNDYLAMTFSPTL